MPNFVFHNRLVRLSDEEAAMLRVLAESTRRQRDSRGGWDFAELELLGQLIYRRFIKVNAEGTRYVLRPKGTVYLEQQAHPVLEPLLFEAFEAGRTSRLDATALPDLAEAMQEYGRLVRARYPSFSRGLRQQLVRQYALGLGERHLRQEPNPLHRTAGHTLPFSPRSARLSGRREPVESGLMLTAADIEAVLTEPLAEPPMDNLDLLDNVFPDSPEVHYDLESTRRLAERLRTL